MYNYLEDILFNSLTKKDVTNCISAGIDINHLNERGRNALFYCSSTSALNAMIEAGIELNHTDRYGNNALFSRKSPRALRLLIKSGINVQHKNDNGHSCLYQNYYNIECAEILINAGVDIHSVDNEGQTLLYDIISPDMFDYWISKGCNINHRDYKGNTALDFTTKGQWWRDEFRASVIMRHIVQIDKTPNIFKHVSYKTLPLIALLNDKGLNVVIAEHCTLELHFKDMKPFLTELKKYTEIKNAHFYNCHNSKHICAYTDIGTVTWFIRNDIKIDDDILRQRTDSDKVFDYIVGRKKT
ncbi:ankyrin repeat domain-containing protein [Salmonella enterica]|nr:ankyrin repeat domain-containing protein [Salmonella enterica]EGG2139643.1 ankyrin repeat domain-containing protein [Salmonella enterica]HCS4439280.1 ankyrin repeat domain-containing protein [Salmonella enterica subsp. enterica serovar Newport]